MDIMKDIVRILKTAVLVIALTLVIDQTVQTHAANDRIGSDTDPHFYFTTVR